MLERGKHHPHYPRDKSPSEDEIRGADIFFLFVLLVWEHLTNRWQSRDLFPVKCRGLVHRTLSACGPCNKPASR